MKHTGFKKYRHIIGVDKNIREGLKKEQLAAGWTKKGDKM